MKKSNNIGWKACVKVVVAVSIASICVLVSTTGEELKDGETKVGNVTKGNTGFATVNFTFEPAANASAVSISPNPLITKFGSNPFNIMGNNAGENPITVTVTPEGANGYGYPGDSRTFTVTPTPPPDETNWCMEGRCEACCETWVIGYCSYPLNYLADSTAYGGSADFKIYLGSMLGLKGGLGYLKIHADAPSFDMYTPKLLEAKIVTSSESELIRDEHGWIRQVKVPGGLFDVATNNQYSYQIRFFTPESIYEKDANTGYYLYGNPARTFFIGSPDASPLFCDKLNFSNIVDGTVVKSYAFQSMTNDFGDNEWGLHIGGARNEDVTKIWLDATNYAKFIQISDANGNVSEECQESYRKFKGQSDQLTSSTYIDGTDLLLSVSYQYYEDPADVHRYGKPAMWASDLIESKAGVGCNSGSCRSGCGSSSGRSGGWGTYNYNDEGLLTNEVNAWLDSPLSSPASQTKMHSRSYVSIPDSGDDSALSKWRPRVDEIYIKNVLVERKYFSCYMDGRGYKVQHEERAASPSAAYGDVSNLITTITMFPSNAFGLVHPEISSSQYADGKLDSYAIEFGTFTYNPANPGNSAFTVGGGSFMRRTITHGTTAHPAGIAWKTTQEKNVLDASGKEVMSETLVYNGTDYERLAWRTTVYNASGRPVSRYSSDVILPEDSSWGNNCCGKVSEKDGYGNETLYKYDHIGRLIGKVRKGVSSPDDDLIYEYGLDSAGRTLYEARRNNSGSLRSIISSNKYDIAGRITKSVNEAGLVTTYSYSNAGRTKTVVSPGPVTNVTALYLDGKVKSISENGVLQQVNLYGVNTDGTQWRQTFTGPAGTNSLVWQKTTTDFLGRTLREEKPGYSSNPSAQVVITNSFVYNAKGQLIKSAVAGLSSAVSTLYEYDELGTQIRSGTDVNNNGILDLNGPDRISCSDSYYEKDASNDFFRVNSSSVLAANNSSKATTNSIQKTRLTGLGTSDPAYGINTSETTSIDMFGQKTITRTYVNRDAKQVTQVVAYPDSVTNGVSVTVNGKLLYTITKTGLRTDYTYDVFGRQLSALQGGLNGPRTVGTYTHYNAKGQVDYTEDAAGNRTSYAYDRVTGRRTAASNAVGEVTYYQYDAHGQLLASWGNVYPVMYDYDSFNRMTAMYTCRGTNSFASYAELVNQKSQMDKTTWLYDNVTGLLTNKVYADNKGPVYTYTPDGKLRTRTWARGITTTYSYTNSGELVKIDYSDATPDVTFTYNRMGRQATITDGQGTRRFTYNEALQLASETNTLGLITRSYDSHGRSSGFSLVQGGSVAPLSAVYGFDSVGRFNSVSSSVSSVCSAVKYSYLPGSDLLAGWSLSSGTAAPQTVSRSYEPRRNLLVQVRNSSGGNLVSQFDYVNDAIGRRTQRVDTLAVTNAFGYNLRSELVAASMGTNSYNFAYDAIGNRRASSKNATSTSYDANALNQYTSVVCGPKSVVPRYDLDGNITNYGVFSYVWDAENRLISVSSNGTVIAGYKYDYMSRRYQKVAAGVTNSFVYDGWNLIAEKCGSVTKHYVWGVDLSGSLQGAGGIGGLLMTVSGTNAWFSFADGNGNITDYVDAGGTVVAHYEFDPYGGTTVKSGVLADAMSYRFSSKYQDDETGLYYYGYRYYDAAMGRWMNRDPLGDEAHIRRLTNGQSRRKYDYLQKRALLPLYLFVQNRVLNDVDPLGLDNTGSGGQNVVCCVTSSGGGASSPGILCSTCANAIGANVLLQLSTAGIDGTDDAGGGNAFRHCLATCQSVSACGLSCARCFWDGRESSGDPAGQQDLANNQVGYAIQGSCWSGCMNAWANGQLNCNGYQCPPRDEPTPGP